MATANLTSTVSSTITLDGRTYSLSKTTTVSNMTNVFQTRMTIGTSATDVLAFAAAAAAGTLTDLDYMMLVNHDTTNFCTITIKVTGGDTSFFKLTAGAVFLLFNRSLDVNTTGAAFAAFNNINEIEITFDTASGDIELLAAFG